VNGDRRQHRRRMATLVRGVHRDDAAWWAEQFMRDLRPEGMPDVTAGTDTAPGAKPAPGTDTAPGAKPAPGTDTAPEADGGPGTSTEPGIDGTSGWLQVLS